LALVWRFPYRIPSAVLRIASYAVVATAFLQVTLAEVRADPIDDRVEELLHWVGDATGYEVGDLDVTVVFTEPTVINIVAYGVDYSGQTDIGALALGTAILLPHWFRLGRDDDVLVHELTHVLQYSNGARFRCLAEREREAYETAAAFVEETGIGTMPAGWFLLFLTCPDPWAQ
jgi:hypothetical protein